MVIYPTDTVYGMGCDIHNARAVERAGWSLLRAKVTMYMLAGVAGAWANAESVPAANSVAIRVDSFFILAS